MLRVLKKVYQHKGWREPVCVFSLMSCGDEPMNRSVFYPSQTGLAPSHLSRKVAGLVGLGGKYEPGAWNQGTNNRRLSYCASTRLNNQHIGRRFSKSS